MHDVLHRGPSSVKEWLGYAASCFINARLRAPISSEQRRRWVEQANLRPAFLAEVHDEVLVPTLHGFSLYCSRRSGIGQTLIRDGEWEALLSRTILACLEPGDVAIDVGANIGYDSLLMSGAVGADGLVFAFEPELQNLALLLRNQQCAPHANVVLQSVALGNENALARISLSDAYFRGLPNLRPQGSGPTRTILATRLDQVMDLAEVQRIAFVKMDIEGYEFRAIQGMGSLLDRVESLSCEINAEFLAQCGSSADELIDYLVRRGFHCFCSDFQSAGTWLPLERAIQNKITESPYYDVFFVRQLKERMRPLLTLI